MPACGFRYSAAAAQDGRRVQAADQLNSVGHMVAVRALCSGVENAFLRRRTVLQRRRPGPGPNLIYPLLFIRRSTFVPLIINHHHFSALTSWSQLATASDIIKRRRQFYRFTSRAWSLYAGRYRNRHGWKAAQIGWARGTIFHRPEMCLMICLSTWRCASFAVNTLLNHQLIHYCCIILLLRYISAETLKL